MDLPPGFVALPLAKGCVCVIPARVYVAGLQLGKTLRRREASEQRCLQKNDERQEAPALVESLRLRTGSARGEGGLRDQKTLHRAPHYHRGNTRA